MPSYIIHKDGVYNLYTTVADGPWFVHGITLEQLQEITKEEFGASGLRDLPDRLERAHKTGCSAISGETLEECIRCNRAGPKESRIPVDEFIAKYLSLPPHKEGE